ncbi:MAG TPA: phosphoribosylamine--glycine ligase [Sedimentibacter sp.]|jgi:phosphoribosylamine--glycine ligase|nr:phosphoribosylamine--glycine ligase [Sedimentibacter sp.]HPV85894.1 phosphoribosylamine--glycine ligase [Sedimentibacter sp.]HPY56524.1 phosphoribosylamine--glycine ligase [Sedimentibacter sp.]HQC70998.1 phosphoribosylamine--glycine ligase [Sedimentibacter sp.]
MKILVVGSGAREHTICWKLKQSSKLSKLYCAPGNAGISKIAECVDIKADELEKLVEYSVKNSIDLVVVGPEVPLVAGLVDMLNEKGIKAFGPVKAGAKFEGSKSYSKDFMKKYSIPSANYEIYTDSEKAISELNKFNTPIVVKADGLAAGKGVLICETHEEAKEAIKSIMVKKQFGEAGNSVVIEEFLKGTEASLLCFVDGKNMIPMESARDYKKAYDQDKGLNTGGMGCFSPNTIFTEELNKYIKENILDRTLNGFLNENIEFKGVLFIGLMIENNQAKVLEYNARFGDPETEVVLPRLKSDLIDIMLKCIEGNLTEDDLQWEDNKCVTVILASGGYPESYEKGKEITGINEVDDDIIIFHGGTKLSGNKTVTDGGRVLAVTAMGKSLEEARKKVYKNIPKINFEKMEYRTDIAKI